MFYRITWFIVAVFLIVPIIGMILMWLRKAWTQAVRVGLTILFCFYAVAIIVFLLPSGSAPDENPDQAQTEQTDENSDQPQSGDDQAKTEEPEAKQPDHDKSKPISNPKKQLKQKLTDMDAANLLNMKAAFADAPYDIELILRGAPGSTESESVRNMKTGILQAVYIVKDMGIDIAQLTINVKYPVVNQNGLDEEQFAIKSAFSGETIHDLAENQADTDLAELDTIADSWWKHPVLDD